MMQYCTFTLGELHFGIETHQVQEVLRQDPLSGHVFAFFNRRRDPIVTTFPDVFQVEFVRQVRSLRRALPRWVPTRGRRRIRRAVQALDQDVARIVADRRARGRFPGHFRRPGVGHGDPEPPGRIPAGPHPAGGAAARPVTASATAAPPAPSIPNNAPVSVRRCPSARIEPGPTRATRRWSG